MTPGISLGFVVGIVAALPGTSLGQVKSDASVRLVAVCEVLKDPQQSNGKNLAILGRFNWTEEGRWLDEADCGFKLTSGSYNWPNFVWLNCCYEPAPDPPSGSLMLDNDVLSEKLAQVRKTTPLKFERKMVISRAIPKDGSAQNPARWMDVKQEWAVAFGRFQARRELRPPSGIADLDRDWGNGFGHLAGAPVQLVIRHVHVKRIRDDQPQ